MAWSSSSSGVLRHSGAALSKEQAYDLLYRHVTWEAILELIRVALPGTSSSKEEWWRKYVASPLNLYGNEAPYTGLSFGATAYGRMLQISDAAIVGSALWRPAANRLAGTTYYAFSARAVNFLGRRAVWLVAKITGRQGLAKAMEAGGVSAALPSGGWSIVLAGLGLALDAWSIYDVLTLRRQLTRDIVDILYDEVDF